MYVTQYRLQCTAHSSSLLKRPEQVALAWRPENPSQPLRPEKSSYPLACQVGLSPERELLGQAYGSLDEAKFRCDT